MRNAECENACIMQCAGPRAGSRKNLACGNVFPTESEKTPREPYADPPGILLPWAAIVSHAFAALGSNLDPVNSSQIRGPQGGGDVPLPDAFQVKRSTRKQSGQRPAMWPTGWSCGRRSCDPENGMAARQERAARGPSPEVRPHATTASSRRDPTPIPSAPPRAAERHPSPCPRNDFGTRRGWPSRGDADDGST